VANENYRLVLRVDDALGGGNVAFEQKRRILDDADGVAVLRQLVVDEAIPILAEALALYERKGNEVSASRARAVLGELSATASPSS